MTKKQKIYSPLLAKPQENKFAKHLTNLSHRMPSKISTQVCSNPRPLSRQLTNQPWRFYHENRHACPKPRCDLVLASSKIHHNWTRKKKWCPPEKPRVVHPEKRQVPHRQRRVEDLFWDPVVLECDIFPIAFSLLIINETIPKLFKVKFMLEFLSIDLNFFKYHFLLNEHIFMRWIRDNSQNLPKFGMGFSYWLILTLFSLYSGYAGTHTNNCSFSLTSYEVWVAFVEFIPIDFVWEKKKKKKETQIILNLFSCCTL